MPAVAITGVIGSGKTTALRALGSSLHGLTFSADEENRRLLEDGEIRHQISSLLGNSCYKGDGTADRRRLTELISGDSAAREALEGILHPRLRAIWKPLADRHRTTPDAFFIAEIPLLYEKGLESSFDRVIVVGCSESTRRERLLTNRSITADRAGEWLKMQLPQQEKIARADLLLWNDGSLPGLEKQIQLLASLLLTSHH
jgi:dephospho-CoA kinase